MTRNPNRMAEAAARLKSRFNRCANSPITYSRGAFAAHGINATIGRGGVQVMEGEVSITVEFVEYFVRAAELLIGGEIILPARGDRITDQTGAIYEVSAPAPMNVYEPLGPARDILKIHTVGPV